MPAPVAWCCKRASAWLGKVDGVWHEMGDHLVSGVWTLTRIGLSQDNSPRNTDTVSGTPCSMETSRGHLEVSGKAQNGIRSLLAIPANKQKKRIYEYLFSARDHYSLSSLPAEGPTYNQGPRMKKKH